MTSYSYEFELLTNDCSAENGVSISFTVSSEEEYLFTWTEYLEEGIKQSPLGFVGRTAAYEFSEVGEKVYVNIIFDENIHPEPNVMCDTLLSVSGSEWGILKKQLNLPRKVPRFNPKTLMKITS